MRRACLPTPAEVELYRWLLSRRTTTSRIARELFGTLEARPQTRVRRDLCDLRACGYVREVPGLGWEWRPERKAPRPSPTGAQGAKGAGATTGTTRSGG